MRKIILNTLLLLFSYCSFSQSDSVYAKVAVKSISITEHRKWIDTSIVIILNKFEYTDVLSLGKIDDIEVGLQLELFKSNLAEKNKIILGMAFFTKEDGKWKLYQNPNHHSVEYEIIKSKASIVENEFVGNSSMSMQDLQVEYKVNVYVIRKEPT